MANQDIYLKLLTQGLSGGAMRAIGLDAVELAEALPTELPASALRVDTVWRMVDGRIFHLEFQTERESSLERFLDYDTRLARRYHAPVRTVVLYEARVASALDTLDLGTIQYRVENVLLRDFQGETVLEVVANHLAAHAWEPADRMRLALALGMQTEDRRALFGQTLDLIQQVPEPRERELITAAILAVSDRFLTVAETHILAKELSAMPKILDEMKNQGREEGLQQVARAMLADGDSVEKIMRITGLPRKSVEALKAH
ncbi:MAG: hypothetical protein M1600_10720 [Firmicutes bacterium]|nr:hypothetical protein [Bacillota bacterium]